METHTSSLSDPLAQFVLNLLPLTGMETGSHLMATSPIGCCFEFITPHGDGNNDESCRAFPTHDVLNLLPLTGMETYLRYQPIAK